MQIINNSINFTTTNSQENSIHVKVLAQQGFDFKFWFYINEENQKSCFQNPASKILPEKACLKSPASESLLQNSCLKIPPSRTLPPRSFLKSPASESLLQNPCLKIPPSKSCQTLHKTTEFSTVTPQKQNVLVLKNPPCFLVCLSSVVQVLTIELQQDCQNNPQQNFLN